MNIKSLFLIILLLLASCAHNPLKRWNLANPDYSRGLAVLEVNVDGGGFLGAGKPCTLYFIDENGLKAWVTLTEGDNYLNFSSKPGVWRFTHVECGLFSKFDLSEQPPFVLVQGKFSFLGKLQLQVKNQKELTFSSPQLDYREYKTQYIALPEEIKARMIHGFTGRDLKAEHFGNDVVAEVKVSGKDASRSQVNEFIRFDECLKLEKTISPFFVGPSKMVAKFSDKGAMHVESTPYDLAISQKMRLCIDDQLATFQKERSPKDLTIEFIF
jgi:hypothetical protein